MEFHAPKLVLGATIIVHCPPFEPLSNFRSIVVGGAYAPHGTATHVGIVQSPAAPLATIGSAGMFEPGVTL
jgi:hypothetical protein